MNDEFLFYHPCEVIEVVDGDTVDLRVDVRFGISFKERFRLYGIDSPEKKGGTKVAGEDAKAHLAWLIETYGVKYVQTVKMRNKALRDKYGRYVAILHPVPMGSATLNDRMVEDGFAVKVKY